MDSFVAIPFRVGWGFQRDGWSVIGYAKTSRNPFQGGMGFSTTVWSAAWGQLRLSQSLSGWDGVFNFLRKW